MIRKTLTILSLIGLLLSVGLWGVSYFNIWYYNHPVSIDAFGGCVSLTMWHQDELDLVTLKSDLKSLGYRYTFIGKNVFVMAGFGGWHTSLRQLYFSWWTAEFVKNPLHTTATFPLWMPTILFALSLYFCRPLTYHRRRKRKKLGLCVKCGYDLRGSSERCPECGTEFEKQ